MLESFHTEGKIEVGIDEVGRGCFAGPLVVGAVVFPTDFKSDLIRDSKKLTEKKREAAYDIIVEHAIAYSVQAVQASVINEVGIEKATFMATELCLQNIALDMASDKRGMYDHIIMDGNSFDNPMPKIPYTTIVKGDDLYLSIGAASILAKVKRDNYMKKVHEIHPQYNFKGSKGYYCKKHGNGLLVHGKTQYHRDKYVATWMKKQKCTVVNQKESEFDVFIGRPSKWGNPFTHLGDGKSKFSCKTREESIEKFEEWITTGDGMYLLKDLPELKGRVLGCYCKPDACHGDILKKLTDKI